MKKTKLCLLVGMLLVGWVSAQSNEENFTSAGEWLELGGLSVEGLQQASDKAIITISGLKIGDRIQVPGPQIQKAIKALWKLQLFRDIQILETDRKGDIIFLKILLQEMPRLSAFYIKGVKRKWQEPLRKIIAKDLILDASVSQEAKNRAQRNVKQWLLERGHYFAKVDLVPKRNDEQNELQLEVLITLGEKTKVNEIYFTGNTVLSDRSLRKQMRTKDKHKFLAKRTFLPLLLKSDQQAIVQYYHTKGYLDAHIDQVQIDTL